MRERSRARKIVKVNVCDLLHFATSPDTHPTGEVIALFLQFKELFTIPTAFIKNEIFKRKLIEK